jgi:hypothetical protein
MPSSSNLPRRAWYPSGPWINGVRPPEVATPEPKIPPGNPDPDNYKIVQAEEIGQYLIIKLNYPNCTNFEGNKILVFKDITLLKLINQKKIDPHFFKHKNFASPIARFTPTPEGWEMAKTFVHAMLNLARIKFEQAVQGKKS